MSYSNPARGTTQRNVSQGGGSHLSLSGGDERSEPESAISKPLGVDLHGPGTRRWRGTGATAGGGAAAPAVAPSLSMSHNSDGSENGTLTDRDASAELVKRMGLWEARRLEQASKLQLSDEHGAMQELWPWYFVGSP